VRRERDRSDGEPDDHQDLQAGQEVLRASARLYAAIVQGEQPEHGAERDGEGCLRRLPVRRQHDGNEKVGADEGDCRGACSLHQGLRPVQHERGCRAVAIRDHAVITAGARIA
jgi:hypothetical protein